MNTGRDELFSLIQSMSKSEKRYFKIEAKKSGEKRSSNYLKLFDAMNDMEEYDETYLRKRFKKEKFIDHLPSEKRYLYQTILKSLRHFRSEKSAYAQIKEMILDAQYLLERGLYEQSIKMLKRARKQALLYEDSLALLEINIKERSIIRHMRGKKYTEKLEELAQENSQILRSIQQECQLLEILEKLDMKLTQQFKVKDSNSIEELHQLIAPIKNLDPISLSANSLYDFYRIKSTYFQLLEQIDKAFEYYKKGVDWWDERPHIKQESFHRYRTAISNLISFFFSKKGFSSHKDLLPLIEKLELEKPQNYHEQGIIFQRVSIFKLLYFMNNGDFTSAEVLVENIENGLNKYLINPSSQLTIIFNVAIFYFSLEKFDQCIIWLDKVINGGKGKNYRHDIQLTSRILNIVCQYEMHTDPELLDNLCRTVYRNIHQSRVTTKKEERGFDLEMISQLKKFVNTPAYERTEAFSDLQQFLEKQTQGVKIPPGSAELLYWVNSRISSVPIIELIQQKG